MTASIFDNCSDQCGLIAAIIAALSYGTYGVPIKETKKYPVHPFVFQTYKTITMFIFCWTVLLMGIEIRFSYWGLLSGLFWVLGGTCGIISIRYAGMAIAVGTWASVMICVNFIWGILIFQEPVADISGTIFSFLLLAIGLIGMSKYSESTGKIGIELSKSSKSLLLLSTYYHDNNDEVEYNDNHNDVSVVDQIKKVVTVPWGSFQNLREHIRNESRDDLLRFIEEQHRQQHDNAPLTSHNKDNTYGSFLTQVSSNTEDSDDNDDEDIIIDHDDEDVRSSSYITDHKQHHDSNNMIETNNNDETTILIFGYIYEYRTIGIICAMTNGILTGTSFIPVHYAKVLGFGGPHYMISYACGALISNILIWIIYFIYQYYFYSSSIIILNDDITITNITIKQRLHYTYHNLPKLYFKELWFPGCMAGTLE